MGGEQMSIVDVATNLVLEKDYNDTAINLLSEMLRNNYNFAKDLEKYLVGTSDEFPTVRDYGAEGAIELFNKNK